MKRNTNSAKMAKGAELDVHSDPDKPVGLYRQGKSYYWRRQMPDGSYPAIPLETTIYAVAKKLAQDHNMRYDLIKAGHAASVTKTYTFEQAVEEWYSVCTVGRKGKRAPRTMQTYGDRFMVFANKMKAMGILTLSGVTAMAVHKAYSADAGVYCNRTLLQNYHEGCVMVWREMMRVGMVNHNPFEGLIRIKVATEDKLKTRYLQWKDVVALLNKAKEEGGRDLYLFTCLAAFGGLRHAEILRARWGHVNWDNGSLWVDGKKTKKSADDIDLYQAFRAAIEEYRGADDELVVYPEVTTFPTNPKEYRVYMNRPFKKIVKAIGIDPKEVHPHTLRHSLAQHLGNNGCGIEQVARVLRHDGISTTVRYFRAADMPIVRITNIAV